MTRSVLIAMPAYNEAGILKESLTRLMTYINNHISDYDVTIVIGNNASQDKTGDVGEALSAEYPCILIRHHTYRSMGRCVCEIWQAYEADIYMHIDADLPGDLDTIKKLLEKIESGAQIALGSRLNKTVSYKRKGIRQTLSTISTTLTQVLFQVPLYDFQTGFKAIDKQVRDEIVPKLVCLKQGFFSTELILVSCNKGFKVGNVTMTGEDIRPSKNNLFLASLDAVFNLFLIKSRLLRHKYDR